MIRNSLEAARQSVTKFRIKSVFYKLPLFVICPQKFPSFSIKLKHSFCIICMKTGFISTSIVETEQSLLNSLVFTHSAIGEEAFFFNR